MPPNFCDTKEYLSMTDKRIETVPASFTDRMFDFGPRLFFIGLAVAVALYMAWGVIRILGIRL